MTLCIYIFALHKTKENNEATVTNVALISLDHPQSKPQWLKNHRTKEKISRTR